MSKQTWAGIGVLGVAVLMFLAGLGDKIAHLQDWDGLTTTEMVGSILKDAANIGLAAIGGKLLPAFTVTPDAIDDGRLIDEEQV